MLLICPIIVLLATMDFSWFESVPVSAEGRVEHQKRNQTATSQWPVGFVFGVQLDYSCRLKSVSSTEEKRVQGVVRYGIWTRTIVNDNFRRNYVLLQVKKTIPVC